MTPDSTHPQNDEAVFAPQLRGENYVSIMAALHDILKPRSYFEIGVLTGDTFQFARCPSIGVDPDLQLRTGVLKGRSATYLFEMTSDRFFAEYNPAKILGRAVDFAFLDGLHVFEALLRDFISTERSCTRSSVIALHDCVPTDVGMTRPIGMPSAPALTRDQNMWAGDVWKILPALKKYRPELVIHILDAEPTGLVLVTNLDPSSSILGNKYFEIASEFSGKDLMTKGITAYHQTLDLQPAALYKHWPFVAKHFRL